MKWIMLLSVVAAIGIALLPSPSGGEGLGERGIYSPSMTGTVAGYRLAGIEPDGDPLDQVVLQSRLSPSGGAPKVNLIVSSYLENFKPDTTPVLPDLLHPNQTAQNLGGFLQGKALLTDDAGNVLYIGSFLAEAFLDNSNHAVVRLDGAGNGKGGTASLKGTFRLAKNGALHGTFSGHIALPPAARRQILSHRGAKMKPLKDIISVVTVRPAPMMGKATHGTQGAPLHTGFSSGRSSSSSRGLSPLTVAAGIGAIVSLLLAIALYWRGRATQGA